jgi:hypothetical protein
MSPPPRDSPSIRTDDELNAKRRGVVAFTATVAMPKLCEVRRAKCGGPVPAMSGNPDFARVFPVQANAREWALTFLP